MPRTFMDGEANLPDGVRHASRRWRTSPEFEGLADELANGAAMDHRLFPVVWPG